MTQLNSRDRLQPSLLDRLIDTAPTERVEGADARVLNRQQLRAAVLRDLSWLFNAIRAEPDENSKDKAEWQRWQDAPDARRSVVNFGMPAFAGTTLSSMDTRAIEATIEDAIRAFEPRISPESLEVKVEMNQGNTQHNTVQIVIRGHMWSQPVPLELLLSADMDVETGHTRVRELRA